MEKEKINMKDNETMNLTKRELEDLIEAGINYHYNKTTYISQIGQRHSLTEDIMYYIELQISFHVNDKTIIKGTTNGKD